MTRERPLAIDCEYDELPSDARERHEAFVDFFGQFFFWLWNWSLDASKKLIESDEARAKLGTVRRKYYDGVAEMTPEQREAAMLFVEETLNGFGERLTWFLGGRSTDLRLGTKHAVRFQVEIEVVDVESDQVVERVTISKGGKKFFGSYWGRWLNRYRDK